MHKTCCNNRPRKRVDMNLMARRPRVPLTNPYLISLSKQEQLCPRRGHKTHFARTLNPDAVYESATIADISLRWSPPSGRGSRMRLSPWASLSPRPASSRSRAGWV